ncbi:outer membrane protein assembly factor BamE [Albimonas sp. CAU 1670]|uniref:outer membrane protein assembly factor BamE n=1 Tax=Albimonas sp. CAU 1670 TaxID=3032599 RepID=UPI0023D99799|nr:outer membrane protein assembly factor BamE [Albimonas sp. CAU 1670]MDF2232082.1 outer membrane protein assembly factor BamE [Albimonas sp. CAU 1670]
MRRASLNRLDAAVGTPTTLGRTPSSLILRSAAGRRGLAALAGAGALLALAACEPISTVHGYAPQDGQLESIQIGVDGPGAVAQKIGRPSTGGVVRDNTWYYVSSRTETVAYNAPEIVERRVVAVHYDENAVVSGVDVYGLEDGRIINLASRTTPTFGRELTVLQQLFGNISNVGTSLAEGFNE